MTIRPTTIRLALSLTLTMVAIAGIGDARAAVQMVIHPGNPAVESPMEIAVRGDWLSTCKPELEAVDFDGTTVFIRASHDPDGCRYTRTQFSVASAIDGLPHGIYPVMFYVGPRGGSVYRLRAFDLLAVGNHNTIDPETGFWWPDSGGGYARGGPGIGLTLERQNQLIMASVNGYATDGTPAWYLFNGPMRNGIVRADLIQFSGGQPLFEEHRPPASVQEISKVWLQFHDHASATVWFAATVSDDVDAELALSAIDVRRYAFAGGGIAGLQGYWQGSINGELVPEPLTLSSPAANTLTDEKLGWRLKCDVPVGDQLPRECRLFPPDGGSPWLLDRIGVDVIKGPEVFFRRIPVMPTGTGQ